MYASSPARRRCRSGTAVRFDSFIQEERGDQQANNPSAIVSVNTPDFERALGISLVRGRSFTPQDDSASEHVVMINEVLARRIYPGQDPVGRLIAWNGQPHWRIVGVLATTRQYSLSEDPTPILYVPERQAPRRSRYVVVRGDAPAEQVIASARVALRQIDPTIALTDVETMERRIDNSLGAQRFRAALMATLGALALALAVIGIYGVVAYSVSRRTREIGIRMALGEASGAVRRRVVIDAFRSASWGLGIGVGLALLSGKWLTSFLVDVSPHDGAMLGVAFGLLECRRRGGGVRTGAPGGACGPCHGASCRLARGFARGRPLDAYCGHESGVVGTRGAGERR